MDFGLGGGRTLPDWAITGTPEECAERVARCHEEDGLEFIGLATLNLPSEHKARLEYLQMIGEEFISRLPDIRHPLRLSHNVYSLGRLFLLKRRPCFVGGASHFQDASSSVATLKTTLKGLQ